MIIHSNLLYSCSGQLINGINFQVEDFLHEEEDSKGDPHNLDSSSFQDESVTLSEESEQVSSSLSLPMSLVRSKFLC